MLKNMLRRPKNESSELKPYLVRFEVNAIFQF